MKLGTEVGHGPGHIVLDGDPALPAQKGHSPRTQFSAHICRGDIVLDGTPKKGGRSTPNFGSCLFWPNGCMDQDETLHGGRPRPRPRCVRRGSSSLAQKAPRKGLLCLPPFGGQQGPHLTQCCHAKIFASPQFSAHVCCGQASYRYACAACMCAVLEGRVVDESDLVDEGLEFPDAGSVRGTSWQDTTSRAVLPTSAARQLLHAQQGGLIL